MAEANEIAEAQPVAAPAPSGGKKRLLLLVGAPILALGALGGGAFAFVPGVRDMIKGSPAPQSATAQADTEKPIFVEIPEMTVTMPNGGRARQLRIKIALELAKDSKLTGPDVLTPRIYDALVLYLRTLRDSEVDGALAIDRMRGDLQRRLDLLLGDGVLRDVLITSLIIG